MIQFSRFDNGGFVLHKIMVKKRKYSAWFSASGKILDAERFSRDNQRVAAVPLDRHRNVVAELVKVGGR